jgi:hypothetical protein
MPGVSTKITWESVVVRIPRIRFRVVCGLGAVMEIFSCSSWFKRDDFTTFGAPNRPTYPDLKGLADPF